VKRFLVALAALVAALVFIGFRPDQLVEGWRGMADVLARSTPPNVDLDWTVIGRRVGETLAIAYAGTSIALALAFPFAILAARTVTPHPLLYAAARAVIAVTRAIPGIVWALLFVAAVGLGPFAGVLAVSVHSIGMLGRLIAESIEDADPLPAQALTATGATRLQVVTQAVLPAVAPSVVGIALYRLDENVRDSIILGVVGAGGLGFEIYTALNLFQYRTAATLLLITLALVLVVERGSAWIRKKVA
jgi:phosphonate transport system permease protein